MHLFPRRPEAGTSDLLNPAALVEEGVMLNKDGAVLAGWRLRGPDLESADAAELEALSARVHRALRSLGNGYELQFQSVRSTSRRYAAAGAFPDPTSMLIEDERRREDPYYRVNVQVDTNAFTERQRDIEIRPGMRATAELQTGSKTILTYLMKPLYKSQEAFREP